ncbi:MAG: glycoside hydrolase family 2 [Sphingobacteriales bacterium 41-5]|nr:MAG: glycoside hydrolase family 2 [Sphingobacteriales bacterium 41-5]
MAKISLSLITLLVLLADNLLAQQHLSLSGKWSVALDSLNVGIAQKWFEKNEGSMAVNLPGTLDDAGIGTSADTSGAEIKKDILYKLTRKHSYIGAAWYYKEISIPANWRNSQVLLSLERALWSTGLWVNGQFIASDESLSTPHNFDVSKYIKTGRNFIAMRIDNRRLYDISIKNLAHAYTDGTQIIWNGVIGKMQLTALNKLHVATVQTYSDIDKKSVELNIAARNMTAATVRANMKIEILSKNNKVVAVKNIQPSLKPGDNELKQNMSLGKTALLWDEFNPNLYTVKISLYNKTTSEGDNYITSFGLRKISTSGNKLLVNYLPVFLRGTLECNVFPLHGYPPMDKAGWAKVFRAAKDYGLNHLRFHSWCPPEAAFEVADSMGFYLQVELPFWQSNAGNDTAAKRFIESEAKRISTEYGNHPSFCLWSLGNELQGDFQWLNDLAARLKTFDHRHLYATTTFTFQNEHGRWPEPQDDFFVTQYTKNGWVRGQGIFNTHAPDFRTDYGDAVNGLPVPVITHEIGQYSVYPDLKEIPKYTGVLEPYNLKLIKEHLGRKDMLPLSDSFTLASGKFSVNLYKEEIERALKTGGISGFQLLDLHDFPGQGTAHIGILNAFWETKGLTTADEHRSYCAPVVPLLRFSKATYTNDERFSAGAEIANYSGRDLKSIFPHWCVRDAKGNILFSGKLREQQLVIGLNKLSGPIAFDLKNFKQAVKLNIEVSLTGTQVKNNWNIWVYPKNVDADNKDVIYTRSVIEAITALEQGKKVLLNPDTSKILGVEGRFTPVFWSPLHFPNQPGTMGILCNPAHPALKNFPTDFYSDWQWWNLISSSKTMVIDDLPAVTPIVRVIDNFNKNRKMANVLELRYGQGKLIVTSLNISDSLDTRPAARQLRYSLLQYMQSSNFLPTVAVNEAQLHLLVRE